MTEIASLLPYVLVYALLLFAAYLLFKHIRKLLKGDAGCSSCPSGGGCSKTVGSSVHSKTENSSCFDETDHDKKGHDKENELVMFKSK